MNNIFISIAMLAVGALLTGGVWLIAKVQDRKRGVLMIIAALVLLGNILIWTLPIG
jgi:predicted MFS family arabinose efflux permease